MITSLDEPQKWSAEWKKPDTEVDILYGSIYMKFHSAVTESILRGATGWVKGKD